MKKSTLLASNKATRTCTPAEYKTIRKKDVPFRSSHTALEADDNLLYDVYQTVDTCLTQGFETVEKKGDNSDN